MNIPKIIFREMSLSETIELVKWAYFENDGPLDVHYYTIKCYPELANLSINASQEKICSAIEEVVRKKYQENKKIIREEIIRYNSIWNKYNDKYFKVLQSLLNIEWPTDKMNIESSIGIIPVFPRFLNDFGFSVSIDLTDSKIIETCAHECLHFLWFEKWKQLYPQTKREEFDSPHLVWEYSEMVVDSILNTKSIKEVLNINARSYDSFYKIKHNNEMVMDSLKNIFSSREVIEDRIKKGYEFIKLIKD